jgi:hypothetical protein
MLVGMDARRSWTGDIAVVVCVEMLKASGGKGIDLLAEMVGGVFCAGGGTAGTFDVISGVVVLPASDVGDDRISVVESGGKGDETIERAGRIAGLCGFAVVSVMKYSEPLVNGCDTPRIDVCLPER